MPAQVANTRKPFDWRDMAAIGVSGGAAAGTSALMGQVGRTRLLRLRARKTFDPGNWSFGDKMLVNMAPPEGVSLKNWAATSGLVTLPIAAVVRALMKRDGEERPVINRAEATEIGSTVGGAALAVPALRRQARESSVIVAADAMKKAKPATLKGLYGKSTSTAGIGARLAAGLVLGGLAGNLMHKRFSGPNKEASWRPLVGTEEIRRKLEGDVVGNADAVTEQERARLISNVGQLNRFNEAIDSADPYRVLDVKRTIAMEDAKKKNRRATGIGALAGVGAGALSGARGGLRMGFPMALAGAAGGALGGYMYGRRYPNETDSVYQDLSEYLGKHGAWGDVSDPRIREHLAWKRKWMMAQGRMPSKSLKSTVPTPAQQKVKGIVARRQGKTLLRSGVNKVGPKGLLSRMSPLTRLLTAAGISTGIGFGAADLFDGKDTKMEINKQAQLKSAAIDYSNPDDRPSALRSWLNTWGTGNPYGMLTGPLYRFRKNETLNKMKRTDPEAYKQEALRDQINSRANTTGAGRGILGGLGGALGGSLVANSLPVPDIGDYRNFDDWERAFQKSPRARFARPIMMAATVAGAIPAYMSGRKKRLRGLANDRYAGEEAERMLAEEPGNFDFKGHYRRLRASGEKVSSVKLAESLDPSDPTSFELPGMLQAGINGLPLTLIGSGVSMYNRGRENEELRSRWSRAQSREDQEAILADAVASRDKANVNSLSLLGLPIGGPIGYLGGKILAGAHMADSRPRRIEEAKKLYLPPIEEKIAALVNEKEAAYLREVIAEAEAFIMARAAGEKVASGRFRDVEASLDKTAFWGALGRGIESAGKGLGKVLGNPAALPAIVGLGLLAGPAAAAGRFMYDKAVDPFVEDYRFRKMMDLPGAPLTVDLHTPNNFFIEQDIPQEERNELAIRKVFNLIHKYSPELTATPEVARVFMKQQMNSDPQTLVENARNWSSSDLALQGARDGLRPDLMKYFGSMATMAKHMPGEESPMTAAQQVAEMKAQAELAALTQGSPSVASPFFT